MKDIEFSKKLLKKYYAILIVYGILLLMAYLTVQYFHIIQFHIGNKKILGQALVILSGFIGIALPILTRIFFINKIKEQKQIASEQFFDFEKNILYLSLTTPVFLILALLLDLNQRVLIVLTIFSLYTIYYYYPGLKKIRFEMKIFRIKSK